MKGLVAHVDTRRVDEAYVMGLSAPDRTPTWGVIGHGQLIETLTKAVETAGHRIINRDYSVSEDGGKMFGAFTLDHTTGELAWMIGFRNSVNKTLKVGITAGTRIFVCDNMAFSGDFIRFRKHTGGLNQNELTLIAQDSVTQMETKLIGFENWHADLKLHTLDRTSAEALTFRAVERGVIPGGRFGSFHKLFFKKENEDNDAIYPNTLWGFHGAVTQLWKKNSLIGSGVRHGELQKLLDEAREELMAYDYVRNVA